MMSPQAKFIYRRLTKLFPNPKTSLHYQKPWEFVFSVILSAQTTDQKVNEVTKTLFRKYPSLQAFASAHPASLAGVLRHLGLFCNKAKYLQNTARLLLKRHKGSIPSTIDELIALPGIGRKSANVILSELFHRNEGIAVDTHVIRLSRLFGLTRHQEPQKIEQDLMQRFPRATWATVSLLFIAYGRTYCHARCSHASCPLREFIT